MKVIRQERESKRMVEQIVAVPQIREHAVGVFKVTPAVGQVSSFFFKMMPPVQALEGG